MTKMLLRPTHKPEMSFLRQSVQKLQQIET